MGAFDLSSFIWPDTDQKRQPQSNYQIDRSNPITAGLQAVINPLDRRYSTNGTLTTALNPAGLAINTTASNSNNAQAPTPAAGAGGDLTFLWVGCLTGNNPGLAYLCPTGASSSFPNGGAYLWYSNGGYGVPSNVFVLGFLDASSNADEAHYAFAQPSATTVVSVVGSIKSGTGSTIGINGALQSATVSGTRSAAATVNGLVAGSCDPSTITGSQQTNLCALWNRALTPAEVASVSANPWQIFQPARLGIAMPAAGSTSSAVVTGTLGALAASAGATQSSTATTASALGGIATSASANQASSATASSTLGAFATQATAVVTALAVAASSLGGLSSSGGATQSQTATTSSSLSLSTSANASQSQSASGASTLGALSTSITAVDNGSSTAVVSSALGSLTTSAQATQSSSASASSSLSLLSSVTANRLQSGAAASTLGALSTSVTATEIPSGTAIAVSTLGGLLSSVQATQSQSIVASSVLPLLTSVSVTQKQSASGASTLGALSSYAVVQPPYTASISGLLGGLSTSISATFGAPSYPVDPAFYVRSSLRPFYAQLPVRGFYAAALYRSFYVRCNPMLITTPTMSSKDPAELVTLTFDGTLELAGATITSVGTPSIQAIIGQDNPPTLVLSNVIVNSQPITVGGVTIAAGCAVQAQCTAGSFGSQYLIKILVQTTNASLSPILKAVLPMTTQ